MDITVIRTFLEVSATGSFVSAAQSLFVTQSAVSLRIQRLEDALGQPLFARSRAGAELTAAGRAFERHAQELIRVWEDARRQVAIPAGFDARLSLGTQDVLWPRLGAVWLDRLREAAPRISLHMRTAAPERLIRDLVEGAVQLALMHAPELRPGLAAERVLEDELVLVAAGAGDGLGGRYVQVDWGAEIARAQALHPPLPQGAAAAGLTLAVGAELPALLLARGLAAYLPAGLVAGDLAAGRLRRVNGARRYAFPAWAVWRADLAPETRDVALLQLKSATSGTAPALTDAAIDRA